jgi:hypothetical protein
MLRRDEDLRATKILGVSPRWLPFDDAAYTALRDPDMIWAALEPFLLDADLVLLPGWPLHHSDHRWVTMLVSERLAGRAPTAYYSELPYAAQVIPMVKGALSGRTSDTLHHILGRKLRWVRSATEREDRDAKARAVASYSGEVANLGYRARIAALHDRLLQHESVGFPHSAHVPPGLFKP